jgi:hypothetical protein
MDRLAGTDGYGSGTMKPGSDPVAGSGRVNPKATALMAVTAGVRDRAADRAGAADRAAAPAGAVPTAVGGPETRAGAGIMGCVVAVVGGGMLMMVLHTLHMIGMDLVGPEVGAVVPPEPPPAGLDVAVVGGGAVEVCTDVSLTANRSWPFGVRARSLMSPSKRESPDGASHQLVRFEVQLAGG